MKMFAENTRLRLLILIFVLVCFWVGAFLLWTASLLFANLYYSFGSDLPVPTYYVLNLSKVYFPFIFATLSSLIVLYAFLKLTNWFQALSLMLLGINVLYLAFALVFLIMPAALCGNMWPDWPSQSDNRSGEGNQTSFIMSQPTKDCFILDQ